MTEVFPPLPPILTGDGRAKLTPIMLSAPVLPNTSPIGMTVSGARQHIKRMMQSGQANHSLSGGTLWLSLHYLQWACAGYVMRAHPKLGYSIEVDIGCIWEGK